MANIKSAKKRAVQSEKRRIRNVARKSAIKTVIKKVLSALDTDTIDVAKELLREAEVKIARAKGKGVFHRNLAIRKISRLAKKVSQKERGSRETAAQ
jgi:small subunit ribosomal protein S20